MNSLLCFFSIDEGSPGINSLSEFLDMTWWSGLLLKRFVEESLFEDILRWPMTTFLFWAGVSGDFWNVGVSFCYFSHELPEEKLLLAEQRFREHDELLLFSYRLYNASCALYYDFYIFYFFIISFGLSVRSFTVFDSSKLIYSTTLSSERLIIYFLFSVWLPDVGFNSSWLPYIFFN